MTWRIVAGVLGACVYVIALIGAVNGSTALLTLVITVTVLVVFVGGGNWIQQWLGIKRRAPRFDRPDLARREGAPSTDEPER